MSNKSQLTSSSTWLSTSRDVRIANSPLLRNYLETRSGGPTSNGIDLIVKCYINDIRNSSTFKGYRNDVVTKIKERINAWEKSELREIDKKVIAPHIHPCDDIPIAHTNVLCAVDRIEEALSNMLLSGTISEVNAIILTTYTNAIRKQLED